jgi:ACS family D-galactonate transporter-like MFS transporter
MTTVIEPTRTRAARRRVWERELTTYPSNPVRYTSLGIVVLATITVYYQFYITGGVAARILLHYHLSFVHFVGINVIAALCGAVAAAATGLSDRYGRANLVIVGVMITSLLCVFGIPNADNGTAFAIVYAAIGLAEGVVLVATPALVRDFSPQLGRASAMGFWTLGPVLGSLVVSIQISSLSDSTAWETHFIVSGVVGILVSVLAFALLRELSAALRDQVMVSANDATLIEARAKGIDVEAATQNPYRHMLKPDILASALAISLFLIIYYLAVGYFPIYFQTVYSMTQAKANELGNWSWSALALSLIVVGLLSDKLRVRKPFMLAGAIGAIAFTILFLSRADNPETTYTQLVLILIGMNVSLGVAFAPWMASYTETIERRNPALVATGLAIYGTVVRCVIAISILLVPQIVTTVTTLVEDGPAATQLATQYSAELATAAKIAPETSAALQTNPDDQKTQMDALSQISGLPVAEIQKKGPKDPAVASAAEQLKALGSVPPQALKTLGKVGKAATDTPGQWQGYYWIAVGGQVLFIPLIFFMAGFWSPRRARSEEEAHAAWLQAELARLRTSE